MDSQTFGSVMCGLGLFRERHKAAPGKPAPNAPDDGDAADANAHDDDPDDGPDDGLDDGAGD